MTLNPVLAGRNPRPAVWFTAYLWSRHRTKLSSRLTKGLQPTEPVAIARDAAKVQDEIEVSAHGAFMRRVERLPVKVRLLEVRDT